MIRGVESIEKQLFDAGAAEFTGRQADRVNYEKLYPRAGRPLVAVGRGDIANTPMPDQTRRYAVVRRLLQPFASSSSLRPKRSMR